MNNDINEYKPKPRRETVKEGFSLLRVLYRLVEIPERIVFGALSLIWRLINGMRRLLANLLFLFIIVVVAFAYTAQKQALPVVPAKGALLLNPSGAVVEQISVMDPLSELLAVSSPDMGEVLLQDILDAIELAASDKNISAIVLQLDDLSSIGISKVRAIGAVLQSFKETGKPVIAYGNHYSQNNYVLASYADEVYMHPMGGVELKGLAVYRTYYKEALDRLAVDYHVFRAGAYKSALEPYERTDMSPEAKQSNQRWLNDMWNSYRSVIAIQRDIDVAMIDQFVDHQDELLAAQGGNDAQTAMAAGLIDGVKSYPEIIDYLGNKVGFSKGPDPELGFTAYDHVNMEAYLNTWHFLHRLPEKNRQKVGVIVASGEIVDGEEQPGEVSSQSLAELIRQAREDGDIKAVVLRVDSPGGSAFASELIGEQLALLRKVGKPLVVSMGSIAASGGYWISAAADEIWATPDTLTGSIGVYGSLPSLSRSLEKIGLYSDGVNTSRLAGEYQLDRPLSDYASTLVQLQVDNVYQRFVQRVAEGRKMTVEQVDAVAQGQVWTGRMAQENGLVDKLGELSQAIEAAARLAGVDDYATELIERQLTPREQFLRQLGQLGQLDVKILDRSINNYWGRFLQPLQQELKLLQHMTDPKGMYSYCLVCLDI